MKKIPTLFERVYDNHKIVGILPNVTPGLEYILTDPDVIPTEKIDGSCCAIIDGELYKRYDAKKGKKPPEGAISCCDPDPVTGHHPHWVKVDPNNKADKWFIEAYNNYFNNLTSIKDGTYEAIGTHFQGDPYNIKIDYLERHGADIIDDLEDRTFEGIREYLKNHYIEGIVFWKDGEPRCKIKRVDFGFEWNGKTTKR